MSKPDNVYVPGSSFGAAGWQNVESDRLTDQDQLFDPVTRLDLQPILSRVTIKSLLDIGAGTATTVEQLCNQNSVDYFAVDVNPVFVEQRQTPNTRKYIAQNTDLPFESGKFHVTYSRAVNGWSAEPRQAIGEQLRVTTPGGFAVFTELDWNTCGVVDGSDALEQAMSARATMIKILHSPKVGFNPGYGAQLQKDVTEVTKTRPGSWQIEERRYNLPIGDYRPFLLKSIDTILSLLPDGRQSEGIKMSLTDDRRAIQDAQKFAFRLPDLVTIVATRSNEL